MRKNGFTLIELIAIIIILAILMLIVLPVMTDIIDQTEISAVERSAANYVEAVETEIARQRMNGHKIKDGTYTILSDGSISLNSNTYAIKVDGDYPTSGSITIENYKVVKDTSMIFTIGDYTASYGSNAKIVVSLTDSMCTLISGEGYAVGSKYTCNPGDGYKTFYVLSSTDTVVSLIMDRNIDEETVSFCMDDEDEGTAGNGDCTGATSALNTKTSGWTSDKIVSKALPTYTQIYNVNNSTDLTSSSWLYGNDGYWTSSDAGDVTYTTDSIWVVSDSGELRAHIVYQGNQGIRPVMTIAKNDLVA